MNDRSGQDVAVRIGDLHALAPGSPDRLVAVGLGSCAGVTIVDTDTGACALAHVFLPELPPGGARKEAGPGTYADVAIPELVRRVRELGGAGTVRRLVAVVAGGAQMFGARPGNDVGERNIEAVRAALHAAGIRIVSEDVGGSKGRTVRVTADRGVRVTVRVVGATEQELWSDQTTTVAGDRLAA